MAYIELNAESLESEHICCGFADKKCAEGYRAKKQWLAQVFRQDYVFRRIDERAKVFLEYGPAENAWVPVTATNYLMLGCFWVSGRYKKQGHGKALLRAAIDAADAELKHGLVTVVGSKKLPFMSDTRWLLNQGFEVCDTTTSGFNLLYLNTRESGSIPFFHESAKSGECGEKRGLVAYYSNRCPFTEYHVNDALVATARERGIPLKIVRLQTLEQAREAPSPATIFSLFYHGGFVTTDISVCLGTRFDKAMAQWNR